MKLTLSIAAVLLALSAHSQNLLPNPSFESHTDCPSTYMGGGAGGGGTVCDQWTSATWSADYFNSCATSTYVSTPTNGAGYQVPYSGVAYVGILAYNTTHEFSLYDNYKEFIEADIAALEPDTEYVATMHISCTIAAFNSSYAVDGFGMFFDTYGTPSTTPIMNVAPQVDYTHYGIITDTMNWVTLTDTFRADSAYTHVIIGVFKNAVDMHKTLLGTDTTNYRAYYYIDGVSLAKLSQNEQLSVEGVSAGSFDIYPNPATTQLTVTAKSAISQLTITNVMGQTVYSRNYNTTKADIDISSLSPGVYLLHVNGTDVRRFVKQ